MKSAPALLALCLALSLAQNAHAEYTESIRVQVFDQNLRPVGGAAAYAEYQLNSVAGYVKTKPVFTDAAGQADLTFSNYETLHDSVQYSYTLFIRYGDQISTHDLIASGTRRTFSETSLKSYTASVRVRDQNGAPLRAAVSIGGKNATADGTGTAYFQLPPGNYTARAEIGSGVRTEQVSLDQDRAIDIEVGLYTLKVVVKDDRGSILNATVEVEGKIQPTDSYGLASFANVTNPNPQVLVRYKEKVKKFMMDLQRQNRQDVVFDNTKPEVKELHASLGKGGAAAISLYVEDPGALPSGIDSVLVTYEVEGVENKVPAYAIGYNTFEARIPPQPEKTFVKYTVRVSDREGNTAFGAGTYVVAAGGEPTGNGTGRPSAPGAIPQGIGVETVVFGVVVFCLIAYGAFYYLKNRGGGMGSQPAEPPAQPPQQETTTP